MGPPRRKTPKKQQLEQQLQQLITSSKGYSKIYNSNLKVIQRRQPGVTAYIEAFPFVTVYHSVEEDGARKWSKDPGEGPFFIVERSSYPPYGLFVMNRAGKEDFFLPIYPEDDAFFKDAVTIYKAFPQYTDNRLAAFGHDSRTWDMFDSRFSVQDLPPDAKGEADAYSLWWSLADSGRSQTVLEIIQRVLDCTRRCQPYPQEYRCGPERSPDLVDFLLEHYAPQLLQNPSFPASPLSQMFTSKSSQANRTDSSSSSTSPTITLDSTSSTITINGTSTPNAVDALFSSLAGPSANSEPVEQTSHNNLTGQSLLQSIFASASQPQGTPQPTCSSPSPSPSPPVVPPQALTQSVIDTLLRGGRPSYTLRLPEDDAASTSSLSTSSSNLRTGRTGRSQEADDESSGFSVQDNVSSISETSTVLDSDLDPHTEATPRVNGDSRALPPNAAPPPLAPLRERNLVPFSDDSELWPYQQQTAANGDQKSAEIPEFDFSDTRSLDYLTNGTVQASQPDTRQRYVNGYATSPQVSGNGSQYPSAHPQSSINGAGHHSGTDTSSVNGSPDMGRQKKNRRRDQRNHEERQQIEQSWDTPASVQAVSDVSSTLLSSGSQFHVVSTSTANTAPLPSSNAPSSSSSLLALFGGQGTETSAVHTPRAVEPAPLDPAKARQAILDALKGPQANGMAPALPTAPRLAKNDFVREVLSLIHTDRSFVDKLWNGYYGA